MRIITSAHSNRTRKIRQKKIRNEKDRQNREKKKCQYIQNKNKKKQKRQETIDLWQMIESEKNMIAMRCSIE